MKKVLAFAIQVLMLGALVGAVILWQTGTLERLWPSLPDDLGVSLLLGLTITLLWRLLMLLRDRRIAEQLAGLEEEEAGSPRPHQGWHIVLQLTRTLVIGLALGLFGIAPLVAVSQGSHPKSGAMTLCALVFALFLMLLFADMGQSGEQDLYEARFSIGGKTKRLGERATYRKKRWALWASTDTAPRDDD